MVSITLKVIEKGLGWEVEFPLEFEQMFSSQSKLDLLQDAIHDLNKKWKDVDASY
jgi:hypothetical protein